MFDDNGTDSPAKRPPGACRSPWRASALDATPELLAELQDASDRLAAATPEEIIAWGVEHYAPYLTMATAFGPEGCVILAMLAKIAPETYVFNLDTGYQFQETLDLRDQIAENYTASKSTWCDPKPSVPEYEALHGGPLYRTNPNQCCFDRKVRPFCSGPSRGMHAWMSGIRARPDARPGPGGRRAVGQKVWARENQPARQLDEKRRLEADHGREDSV